MKEKPNYYAIIPADVRYDNELKDKAKLLYGEITSLSDKYGYCYASNKYFAELYGVTVTTISLLIKNLVEKGYIESEIKYKEGSKEILNRYLKILKEGYLRNLKGGIKENLKDNNTSINNTRYNNINKKDFYENNELNNLFKEFLELRKKIKAVNSERAINMLLNKLSKYEDNIKIKMIERSILNSWKDVYELPKEKYKEPEPSWLNQEIKERDELTDEEREWLQSIK